VLTDWQTTTTISIRVAGPHRTDRTYVDQLAFGNLLRPEEGKMASAGIRQALRNVLWIGGSLCAGKTTTARLLAERHTLRPYHFDRQEPFHVYRSIPERQPHVIGFMAMTMDQRWVLRSPEEMAAQTIASWSQDRFPMVIDDLSAMADAGPIVAEGAGLFPENVAPLLADPRTAIWLLPTPEFIRQVRGSRGESVTQSTSDPARAFENLVARDALITQHVRWQAEKRHLTMVNVDADTIVDVARIVESHFSPTLDSLRGVQPDND
jgi:hypothetical protein